MSKKASRYRISDQQYTLMDILWRLGRGSARDVLNEMQATPAYTTVATLLTRLEKKGLLKSEVQGRERVYSPAVKREQVNQSMISGLVSTVFRGDSAALMAHLVREGEMSADDLEDIRRLLEQKEEGDKQ